MTILRDFMYLNADMLKNYLSSIEGYSEEEFDYTESERGQKGGKLGHTLVEGNVTSEKSQETKGKRVLTPPVRFQKLYETLEAQEQIKHIDLFDQEYWSNIQKGELLEIQAKIRIPTLILQLEQIQGITPFIDLVQKYGSRTVTDPDLTALAGLSDLRKITDAKPIPLLFQAAATPGYSFAADMSREYMTAGLMDFQGEATVFGKVQRILTKGQKVESFSLIPDMLALPTLNRQQRLALKSNKNKQSRGAFTEQLAGPAIILTALAVYR